MKSTEKSDPMTRAHGLALFRIAFYLGLLLHFLPSFWYWNELYGCDRFPAATWAPAAQAEFAFVEQLPAWLLPILASAACLTGVVGLGPRASALVAGVSLYALCSLGSLATQTLALSYVWFVLWTLVLFGGGDEVLSVTAYLRGKRLECTRLTGCIIGIHLMLTLFVSGIEKLASGWISENAMARLLMLPKHTMLRDWVTGVAPDWALGLGHIGSVLVPLLELTLPLLMLIPRFRAPAVILVALFFVGVVGVLQVPPLFAIIYCAGCALLLPPSAWQRLKALAAWAALARAPRRVVSPGIPPN